MGVDRRVAALVGLLLFAVPRASYAAGDVCADPAARTALRQSQARELLPVIEQGIETPTPHDTEGGGQLFQTSYDWHSSVHAHWAMLSIARFVGDSSARARELGRITAAALESEREALNANPTFELPYGQSWLLLLLSELSRTSDVSPDLGAVVSALQNETLERVLGWLESSPFPENGASGCDGEYDSWSMAYLLLKNSNPTGSARLSALATRYTAGAGTCLAVTAPGDDDFVSPAAIARVLLDPPAADPAIPADPGALLLNEPAVPVSLDNCHELGREISLYWPAAAASHGGNVAACEGYSAFLASTLSAPRDWDADFLTESHWLPQFLWLSIWTEQAVGN